MRTVVVSLALLFVAAVALGQGFALRAGETETIEIPGATAAWAVDPNVAEASVERPGRIVIRGLREGRTQIMTARATGTQSFLIAVGPGRTSAPPAPKSGAAIARADSRYASSAGEVVTSVDVYTQRAEQTAQAHATLIHRTENLPGRSSEVLPSIFYRVRTPRGGWTLFDELVDVSPLSVRGTQVRGIHVANGPLELHAGYAAPTMYEDLLLPADRRWMAGGGYAIEAGGLRWIPSAWTFLSEPDHSAARRGSAVSLAVEEQRGQSFFARAELAVSRSVAAAGELRFDGARDTLRAAAWVRPEDFPTLGLTDLPGTHGELTWSRRQSQRLTFDSQASWDDVSLGAQQQSVGIASVSARYALTRQLALTGGADYARQAGSTFAAMRTIAVPAGIAFDLPSFGASIAYRAIDNSAAGRRGDALRLTARATAGALRINGWGERQRQAPTLDLIFRSTAGLEPALLDLGLSVRTPADLARVLRDNAALISLGYIEGVTVNLAPERVQAGMTLAIGTRNQLRLRTAYEHVDGIGADRQTVMAQLVSAWQIARATELYGSYSRWRIESDLHATTTSSFEIGIRQRLDDPGAVFQRGASIEGMVFLDPAMEGARGAASTPLADIAVTLDGRKTTQTDRAGAFTFRNVGAGQHIVTTELPASRAAFFTTPSRVETSAPSHVEFGVVWSPARIAGRLTSDAKVGNAGVVVSADAASGKEIAATTDSNGGFVLAVPPGHYAIAVAHDSIPSGYVAETSESTIDAAADAPRTVALSLHALRSIAGRTTGTVRLDPTGRVAQPDAGGNFVFRSVPAGSYTVSSPRARARVEVPAEPGVVKVDLR